MKYLITISYDGSKYYGLQKLKNKNTVQGELEKVLTSLNEKPVAVKASGRTDRGVHALNQKCHFILDKEITPYKLRYYLNRSTSKYLYIKDCTVIDDSDFHARFSVKSKTYEYRINVGEFNPIFNDYVFNYNKTLDIEKMKSAAKLLEGPHSYKAFVSGVHPTYDSIIDNISIIQENDNIIITIKGKSFYTYMVRNIVSVLILIGSAQTDESIIHEMFKCEKKVKEYKLVPACGLYLKEVIY